MKRKLVLVGICLLLLTGCGSKIPTLKNGEEAVVQFENGDKISVDTLYEELKKTSTLQVLMSMIDKKILEDKYKDSVEEAKEQAKVNLDGLKNQYGEDQALQMLQMYGFQTFDDYEAQIYISYLQDLAIEDYAKTLIKEKEIKKYYEDETVGDIKVSQILISPDVTDDMSDSDKTKAEDAAKKEAESIIKTLNDTKKADVAAKFAELAKDKSDETTSAKDGGNMGFVNKETLPEGYEEFSEAAYKLKDGEYTTKVVKSELGYHVILKVETKAKPKLDTVRESIIEKLVDDKISSDSTVSIKAMQELRKEYGMDIIDSDIKTQYTNYIQNSIQSAKEQDKEQ